MKRLEKKAMKALIGGKKAPGPGCRCVPAESFFTYCYIVAPQSQWIGFCTFGKRYECLDPECI